MTSQQLFVPCACLELLRTDSINFNRLNPVCFLFCEIPFAKKRTEAAMRPTIVSGIARGDAQVSYGRHPGPPIFPVYPIICVGCYKEPIFQEILLYFL